MEVPVGEALIGRVVDPLGRPVDGLGDVTDKTRPVETPARVSCSVSQYLSLCRQGLKAVMPWFRLAVALRLLSKAVRLGRRPLPLMPSNQRKVRIWFAIYVAIGQKNHSPYSVETLRQYGALDYTIVVTASASQPSPLLSLAPYAGVSDGRVYVYWQACFDCLWWLVKRAVAYRELSSCTSSARPWDTPGDVFYLHSRLLERSAKVSWWD